MFKPSLKLPLKPSIVRAAAGPALLTLLLAGTAACGHPSTPGTGQATLEPAAATAADATTAGGSPAAAAPGPATPRARSGAGSGSASGSANRPSAGQPGTVAVAPAGERRAAVGSPAKDGGAVTPTTTNLQLTGYDAAAGTAVLTGTGGDTTAAKAGQLLASPPTEAAPQGALLAVTGVKPGAAHDSLALTTRPANLSELLGSTEADGQVPIDVHGITVTPLVKDLKATVAADGPGGVKADASGTLQVDLNAPVPLPDGLSLAATGSLQLHPAVHFAYHGAAASSPRTASVGFDLGAHAHWKVTGDAKRGTGATPVRVPFAKLQANPVLTVAGLPVVVNLGLTCYLEVSADGQVHLEAEQDAAGTWAVRADYTGGKGWTSTTDADTKVTPVQLRLNGKASVRAALGADINLGLYDTVGVEAGVAPYLSARAEGSLTADSSGKAPQAQGSWSLVGGVDLNGALLAHLKIFGTPIIEGKLPLPPYHREWPLLTGSAALPSPRPST
ncbi:hypothetical protein ACIBCA_09215 [Kitasatospora sp. NPDC051170]|uniref:hypothetical protein n=1 Tax=Kitasatospora sp. NPDC051170 TaxID=3364056 RepID=UPI0037AC86BF